MCYHACFLSSLDCELSGGNPLHLSLHRVPSAGWMPRKIVPREMAQSVEVQREEILGFRGNNVMDERCEL